MWQHVLSLDSKSSEQDKLETSSQGTWKSDTHLVKSLISWNQNKSKTNDRKLTDGEIFGNGKEQRKLWLGWDLNQWNCIKPEVTGSNPVLAKNGLLLLYKLKQKSDSRLLVSDWGQQLWLGDSLTPIASLSVAPFTWILGSIEHINSSVKDPSWTLWLWWRSGLSSRIQGVHVTVET